MNEELPVAGGRISGLSHRVQWLIVAVAAFTISLVLGVGFLGGKLFSGPSDANAGTQAQVAAAPGAFRPTAQQLAGLKIAAVATMTFRTEHVTDGKIALNKDRMTPVYSPFSGRVIKVLANLGDHVEQGAPLLAVEASEFVQLQNELIASVAALDTARSQLKQAQVVAERKRELYKAKGASLHDWQQSEADLIAAQNTARSAGVALASVRNQLRILGKTDKEISTLEKAQRIDPVAYVLAPISGTVTERAIGPGQYIQAGSDRPVYSIGDLSALWLIANVREQDAPLMRTGNRVEVRVLAMPDRVFTATLTYVAPSVDPNTRRLPVRAEVDNADGLLKPEMFANFSIISGGDSEAVAVPDSAVIYEAATARVWVLEPDGSLAIRPIKPGRTSSSGMIEVLAGVNPGDKVVSGGALFIDRALKVD